MAPLGDISLGTFADFGFVVPRIVVQVYAGYTLTNQYTVLWKLEEKLEFPGMRSFQDGSVKNVESDSVWFFPRVSNFEICNVGVGCEWKDFMGTIKLLQPTLNCPEDLSNCSLWICPNYIQMRFAKEAALYFCQNKASHCCPVGGGGGQWWMSGLCINFPNIPSLVQ